MEKDEIKGNGMILGKFIVTSAYPSFGVGEDEPLFLDPWI